MFRQAQTVYVYTISIQGKLIGMGTAGMGMLGKVGRVIVGIGKGRETGKGRSLGSTGRSDGRGGKRDRGIGVSSGTMGSPALCKKT